MPTFDFTSPEGKTYSVEGPDGATPEQAFSMLQQHLGQQPSAPVTGTGLAKAGGIGMAEGAIGLAGMQGDIGSLYSKGASKLGDLAGLSPETTDRIKSAAKSFLLSNPLTAGPATAASFGPSSADIQGAVEKATGPFYQPQNTAEQYAKTVGEFLPAAAAGGPAGIARRVITQAVIPALASETAGQATKGTAAEPYARTVAALAAPLGATVAENAARRIITPIQGSQARQAAVQTLANEGVPVTAGQATGSNALRYMESSLGDAPFAGNQATNAMERQGEAFTQAVMRRAGENANRATPQAVDAAFTRIGNDFDTLAQRNTLRADPRLNADLQTAVADYNRMVGPNARAPVVQDMADDIRNVIAQNGGQMPGAQYQAFRSRLDRYARAAQADPQLSTALHDLRGSLDDAMGRSISPADRQAWQQARNQYRNMLVIEKAATGSQAGANGGILSPSAMRNAVVGLNGRASRRAYGRGLGDFSDLVHAGDQLMKPLPQSGTAPRAFAAAMPAIVGAGIAGGSGAALGAAGSVVAPGMLGRALMSGPVQAYLGNQALPAIQHQRLTALQRLLLTNSALMAPRLAPVQNTP